MEGKIVEKIFDSHIHINKQDIITKKIKELLKDIEGTVFINPKIPELLCDKGHRVKTHDYENNDIGIICTDCGKLIFRGEVDPYREYNKKLINVCRDIDNAYPVVYLSISKNTFKGEIDYFEGKYSGQFVGYKVHPRISGRSINEVGYVNTQLPFIIHTGFCEHDNPMEAIKFAKKVKGNVVLAHLARIDKKSLQEAKKEGNVFLDISPIRSIMEYCIDETHEKNLSNRSFEGLDEIMEYVLDIVSYKKLLYGSDVPYGNIDADWKIVMRCEVIDNSEKKCILYENAKGVFNIE